MADEIGYFETSRRRIRPVTVAMFMTAACVSLLALAFFVGLYLSNQRVKEELAKVRAAGEPLTMAELEASYCLPADSRDATELWIAAANVFRSKAYQKAADVLPSGDLRNFLPDVDGSWPEQGVVEQFLAEQSSLLAKLHEAASFGGAARYPTRFADDPMFGNAVAFQHEFTGRALHLLLLEAKVHARHGDVRATVESVHAIFAMTRSFDRAPIHGTWLMQSAHDALAIEAFERLLPIAELSDDDLALLDQDLATIDYCTALHRGMLGERVDTMQIFAHPDVLGGHASKWGRWSMFRVGDFAAYLQLINEAVAGSDVQDALSLRAAMDRVHDRVSQVTTMTGARWRFPITVNAAPSTQALTDAVCRGTARRDVARTAIAAQRYRRANGQWPKLLVDLVPDFTKEIPIDPFSGVPIRIIATDSECRIYSVGPDGVDQGGIADEDSFQGDITFRLTRATAGNTGVND